MNLLVFIFHRNGSYRAELFCNEFLHVGVGDVVPFEHGLAWTCVDVFKHELRPKVTVLVEGATLRTIETESPGTGTTLPVGLI